MAAITGNLCGFVHPGGGRPCARRVKSGEMRCWEHKGERSSGEAKPATTMEEVENQRRLIEEFGDLASPKHIALGNAHGFRKSMIMEFTPVAADALEAIDAAYEKSGADLSIPREAQRNLSEKGLDWFVDLLESEGLDKSRVSKMKVAGFNRMTTGGKKQHADEALHEVLLIDAGTPSEVVVDPHIAMFAPVKEQDRSVEDQLPSGETPFGDLPWIGTVNSYVGGDYLWWDKFRMERGGR